MFSEDEINRDEDEDGNGGNENAGQDEVHDDDAVPDIKRNNSDCSGDDITLSVVRWSKRTFTPDFINFTEDVGPRLLMENLQQ